MPRIESRIISRMSTGRALLSATSMNWVDARKSRLLSVGLRAAGRPPLTTPYREAHVGPVGARRRRVVGELPAADWTDVVPRPVVARMRLSRPPASGGPGGGPRRAPDDLPYRGSR